MACITCLPPPHPPYMLLYLAVMEIMLFSWRKVIKHSMLYRLIKSSIFVFIIPSTVFFLHIWLVMLLFLHSWPWGKYEQYLWIAIENAWLLILLHSSLHFLKSIKQFYFILLDGNLICFTKLLECCIACLAVGKIYYTILLFLSGKHLELRFIWWI